MNMKYVHLEKQVCKITLNSTEQILNKYISVCNKYDGAKNL